MPSSTAEAAFNGIPAHINGCRVRSRESVFNACSRITHIQRALRMPVETHVRATVSRRTNDDDDGNDDGDDPRDTKAPDTAGVDACQMMQRCTRKAWCKNRTRVCAQMFVWRTRDKRIFAKIDGALCLRMLCFLRAVQKRISSRSGAERSVMISINR